MNGNSAVNRLLVQSNTVGTPRTLTAATVSVTNADFQDITGAGVGNWNLSAIAGGSGDAGGNSGIIFTTAATQTANGTTSFSWSNATRWTSRVPLPQDDAVINNAFGTSQIITADMPRWGKSINFTGATWTTALTVTINTSPTITIFGSLTLISGLTWTQNSDAIFAGRGSYSITSNAVPFRQLSTINAPGGTYTLQDAYTNTNASGFTVTNGILSANNVAVNIQNLTMGAGGTLLMGTNTWTLTGTGTVWTGAGTITPSSSTIKITNTSATARTFSGGGKTYNNFWNATAGTGIVVINGSNTFNDFKIDAGRTQQFAAGTTQTVASITANGAAGNLATLRSTSSPTKWTISAVSVSVSYVDVMDSTGSGTASPFSCGATCVNNGNNTGWTF